MGDPTEIVTYIGPPRRLSVGGVWLQQGETYELPRSTVDRYHGMWADRTVGPAHGPESTPPPRSILDSEPPPGHRATRDTKPSAPAEKKTRKKRRSA